MEDFPAYQPRMSNCFFWAGHQLRHFGGYGLIRAGHNGVPFHVLWIPKYSPDHMDVYSYEPLEPHWRPGNILRGDMLLLFRGHVLRGEETELERIATHLGPGPEGFAEDFSG